MGAIGYLRNKIKKLESSTAEIANIIDDLENGGVDAEARENITEINELLGDDELETEAQTVTGAINELKSSGTGSVTINDTLTSSSTTEALSAKQGKVLKDELDAHKAETMTYRGKKFTLNNPYRFGGSLHLKGQMHNHTLESDGANTPADLVTAYKNAGYDFITITDHDVITADPAVPGITWIGKSVEETNPGKHIVGYDVTTQSALTDAKAIIDEYYQKGGICSVAHPNWIGVYALTAAELLSWFGFTFLEVYNAGVTEPIVSEALWDNALSASRRTWGLAVDDCHDVNNTLWFNKGWVVVHANENSKAAIWDSLKNGNFYASTGNDISVSLTGNVITASSAESSNITFIGENGKVLQTNNGVTSAVYTIQGSEMYVRVKSVKVSDSTSAWSQPIFVDIIGDNDKLIYDTSVKPTSYATWAARDMSAASGVQTVNLPFKAKSILIYATVDNTNVVSQGIWAENNFQRNIYQNGETAVFKFALPALSIVIDSFNVLTGTIQNVTATGFEINWVKVGAPTGTLNMIIMASA